MSPRLSIAAPLLALVLAGCSSGGSIAGKLDSDGDGLSDFDELLAGSDPQNPDTDGDGLGDLDEQTYGTHPRNPDSDGDTYLDGDEVEEGSDPTDEEVRIYEGYWPYNREKDSIADPGFSVFSAGDIMSRQLGIDQYGDEVDLYDFAAEGTDYEVIIIDVSASWEVACTRLSAWLSEGRDVWDLEEQFGVVREGVDSGTVQWITIIAEDNDGEVAQQKALRDWADAYPHDKIPVLNDPDGEYIQGLIQPTGYWPAGIAIDADTMEIIATELFSALEAAEIHR